MPTSPISPKSPIHYGGTMSKRGRLSTQPYANQKFPYLARVEKLVRLDLGFANSGIQVPDADIAKMIGRSARHVQVMRRKVEYLRFRTSIQTGVALDTDQSAKDIAAYRREYFKSMLPDAIRAIADELQRPATTIQERKLKVELAKEVMDREGSFPKISRSDIHAKVEHNYDAADAVANELLSAMDAPVQRDELDATTFRVLTANQDFSNSETVTFDQQEAALASLENMQPLTEVEQWYLFIVEKKVAMSTKDLTGIGISGQH